MALELYERKEATVFANEVRAFLGHAHAPAIAVGEPTDTPRALENTATRMEERCNELILAHDWERLAECYSEDIVFSDRRPVMRTEIRGRVPHMENTKLVVELGVTSMEVDHLIVRGERLTLSHTKFGDKRGEHMVDALGLGELDDAGRIAVNAMYDHAQLAEATQALEERFLATEAAPFAEQWRPVVDLIAGINARDWAGMRAVLHDDLEGMDHRQLGWGRFDADDFVGLYRSATEGAEDAWFGIPEIHALTADGACTSGAGFGTTDQGAQFRTSATIVLRTSGGKITRADYFSEDDVEAGLAALQRPAPAPLENGAFRAFARLCELGSADRWEESPSLLSEDVVSFDHRPIVGGLAIIGIPDNIAASQGLNAVGVSSITPTAFRARGDRLSLSRVRYALPPEMGVESEALQLVETDEAGFIVRNDVFDVDQYGEVMTVIEERYAAITGAEAG